MSYIVAKRAMAAAGYYPAFKKARIAYGGAKFIYANRGKVRSAARVIGSAYRRYRMNKTRKRAQKFRPPNPSPGSDTSKTTVIVDEATFSTINDRVLTNLNLANVGHTTINSINGRQRNMINLRGFRICLEIKSIVNEPLYVNIAIVVPRLSGFVDTSNWFRGNDANRAQAFSNTICTSMEYHCLNINTDKYAVLLHKRYLLSSNDDYANNGAYKEHRGKNYMNFDRYIKFNKQVRFETNADTAPEAGVPYLVHWCSRWGEGLNVTQAQSYQVRRRVVTYFREPKC